jgi:hypothetical protein
MPNKRPSKGRTTERGPAQHKATRSAQSHHGALLTQWVGGWGGAGGTRHTPPTEHNATQHIEPNRRHSHLTTYLPPLVLSANVKTHAPQTAQQRTHHRAQARTTQSTPVSTITPRGFANTVGGGMGRGGRHKAQTTHRPRSHTPKASMQGPSPRCTDTRTRPKAHTHGDHILTQPPSTIATPKTQGTISQQGNGTHPL